MEHIYLIEHVFCEGDNNAGKVKEFYETFSQIPVLCFNRVHRVSGLKIFCESCFVEDAKQSGRRLN